LDGAIAGTIADEMEAEAARLSKGLPGEGPASKFDRFVSGGPAQAGGAPSGGP